jgi:phage recombination protein Bet
MSTAITTLANNLATKLGMGEVGSELISTLKATAFKGQVTDAQFTALMVVANQYGLNPWTREIYAFPDSNNGIVPVVGVDGWSRIINDHPQFDGMDFEQDDESCTCKIYRKDRNHPISATEYLDECRRDNSKPWKSHPKRMLRHKALIQAARLAFGYTGIFDQDEAEGIVNGVQPAPSRKPNQAATHEINFEERDELIKVLEGKRTSGQQVFRDAWKALTPAQKELVGIPERNRIDAQSPKPDPIDVEFTVDAQE